MGRIASCTRESPRFLKSVRFTERNKSYYSVCLFKKKIRVHRLIALTFLPNPNNHPEIDHINGDSLDNRVENLRWCSHMENMKNPTATERLQMAHKVARPWYTRVPGTNPKAKKRVVQIKDGIVVKTYLGAIDTESDGFCASNVTQVCRGKTKTHKGFQWMYLEDYEKSISPATYLG